MSDPVNKQVIFQTHTAHPVRIPAMTQAPEKEINSLRVNIEVLFLGPVGSYNQEHSVGIHFWSLVYAAGQ